MGGVEGVGEEGLGELARRFGGMGEMRGAYAEASNEDVELERKRVGVRF